MDAAKIKQVILNLCKNAVEAMPQGGCLTLNVCRSGQTVVLEISDNGIGVPDSVNMFELFKTTKPGGSGIGLLSSNKSSQRITARSRAQVKLVTGPRLRSFSPSQIRQAARRALFPNRQYFFSKSSSNTRQQSLASQRKLKPILGVGFSLLRLLETLQVSLT